MVKLENISFSYNKKQEFIKDLSLEFKSGEVTTILGPNGSGKSTLLHMISTYLKPKSGKIYLGDKDLGKLKQKEIAKYISCVYQENEAPDDITVRDLVAFGRTIYPNVKKEDKEENKVEKNTSDLNKEDNSTKNIKVKFKIVEVINDLFK